jgi:hypothetical protein
MIGTDSVNFELLRETLQGQRPADEQTFDSIAVLAERLERLKQLDKSFADVSFSPAMQKLAKQEKSFIVC